MFEIISVDLGEFEAQATARNFMEGFLPRGQITKTIKSRLIVRF